ncbi:uncharacterized protein Pyn_39858 [Prunus yedoensis var. nudiflora]|uniref:Uncharacterized protein n=1 Tax=Prunus yedoensis var. nudiflora TaxID=2094558 RepID=A0A314ZG85_PRUYE|nr:uncharacterized protein Pyn_39858 [Prunus yedoensis var. nudiflora]
MGRGLNLKTWKEEFYSRRNEVTQGKSQQGQGGEFAFVAEASKGDESSDSVDGRSIASVATQEDDTPSEVEESIDVFDCEDGSVAGFLAGQIDGFLSEGQGGLDSQNLGGTNNGDIEKMPGFEGVDVNKGSGSVHILLGNEKMKITEQEAGNNKNLGGGVGPANQYDTEGDGGGGSFGKLTKDSEFLSYSRKKRLGTSNFRNPSEEKHSRILAKLNLTMAPIRKQLAERKTGFD